LIAPAGFGKTTTVHAAALAASRAGHPVVGLAATNQAAGDLRLAGIPATTIARFALDGAALPPGAAVVLDEVSQVATTDAELVLGAVGATPGARIWCLGDPHQAQAVRAGGLGDELARLGHHDRIPAPQLTQNRRQLDAGEREALAHYRAGHIAVSQAIRSRHGWEHDLGSPHATREALADAVAADINLHGPAGVVALAVSHADCEDLADRIRDRLRATGHLHGPELAGPAWGTGERRYAAGDRVLVHGTLRTDGRRLHNGTVVTVTAVATDGLQTMDGYGRSVTLPRSFVEGHRTDGSPNCSHAWARTVDGIQGATWPQVHLLGTAALERFTGYTGQSRSRQPTHTWNVIRLPEIDFGGVLADQRTPARQVLDALLRTPDTGFATHDDPARIRRLLAERDDHRAILAGAPPDRRRQLTRAEDELRSAQQQLSWANHRLDAAHDRLAGIGPLSQLRRQGRHHKRATLEDIERFERDVDRAADKMAGSEQNRDRLRDQVAQGEAWHAEHDWRRERLATIDTELAGLGHLDLRDITLPEHSTRLQYDRSRPRGRDARLGRVGLGHPEAGHEAVGWAGRLPEIAAPPLPEHDPGLGMDLGL
ncbi:MAG: AAA family ATPase, partial [Acidimicrobiia bacterium]